MNLTKLNLGQLYTLARHSKKYRYAAVAELDRRIPRNESK